MKKDIYTLAIDTTAKTVTAAILKNDDPLGFYSMTGGNTHSETLLPAIEMLLKNAKLTVEDISLFAVTKGPGSFTGVRIGAAVIKGLAFGRDVACVTPSSLNALAYNAKNEQGYILTVMDARKNQLYCAVFERLGERMDKLTDDMALSSEEFAAKVKELGITSAILVGDGSDIAEGDLKAAGIKTRRLHPLLSLQNAYSVGFSALNDFVAGFTLTPEEILPTYLRGFN